MLGGGGREGGSVVIVQWGLYILCSTNLDGDCILCTKQVVDGGSGVLSNLVCRRRRLPP